MYSLLRRKDLHYRPLDHLGPLHLALLATLEKCGSVRSASAALGVPIRYFQCAGEELRDWDLLGGPVASPRLTPNGKRCVGAWRDTGKMGFWRVQSDSTWVLGPGAFSFRNPLASLDEAGLNPETGNCLSEGDAKALLAQHQCQARKIDGQLERREIYKQLSKVLRAGGEAERLFHEGFKNLMTRRHLTLLSEQTEEALSDFQNGARPLREADSAARGALKKAQKSSWRRIRKHEEEAAMMTNVLLAQWLRQRGRFLSQIAERQLNRVSVYAEGEKRSRPPVGLQGKTRKGPHLLPCAAPTRIKRLGARQAA